MTILQFLKNKNFKLLQYLKHRKEINHTYQFAGKEGLCDEMNLRERLAYWKKSYEKEN